MFIQIIAIIVGIVGGIFTGLIPGIHINLVIAFLLTQGFSQIEPLNIVIFIVALGITHTFIDFIPSIFLGAASEDTISSILPGHKYLLLGEGHKALKLTLIGSTIAVTSLIIVLPAIYLLVRTSIDFINQMMGFFLISTIIFLFIKERESKIIALLVFFLAGVLGVITLNSQINEPLLPLLTGLFGASTLINSIKKKTKIPKQKITKLNIQKEDIIKPTIRTMIISPLCSFLPGLGASQAATIASSTSFEKKDKEYLILLGSINTLVLITSFFTLYLINKTRTGAASAINQIITVTPQIFIIILIVILTTTAIIIPITLIISKIVSKKIHIINYTKISIGILLFISITILYISGFQGFFVYIICTLLGIFTINNNITRSHLMGVILLPTTIYYLPLF